jgi:GT2 family glycosyltransferase
LVFLNNDTITLDGWLSALLRTFHRIGDAGAVGGKLIFPDGRLQEAGNVMFRDGTGANFGKWDPKPAGPLYSYLRDVDYCSGALLATPRALFEEIGGFDKRFRPAYYEDADYCFQVRRQGLRVVYQPESAVVHLEGGTSGTDLTVGPKRAQVRNRERFRDKWRSELADRPRPPTQYDLVTWYQLAYAGEAR